MACDVDGLRPAVETEERPPETHGISTSVKVRRKYGRQQKQRFYLEETGIDADFTNDFDELSSDSKQGNLDHKLALIYLDGNKFTEVRDQSCTTADALTEFDDTLKRGYLRNILKELLNHVQNDPNKNMLNGHKIRLETLLWGGDELIWVVPAWKGWEVLQLFFDNAWSWSFDDTPLTFAGGLVFAHHNAPIQNLISLSHALAEKAKARHPRTHSFQYLVMESFDRIGMDLDAYRRRVCPALQRLSSQDTEEPKDQEEIWKCAFRGGEMNGIAQEIRTMKQNFPRGQVYKAIQNALSGTYDQFQARLQQILPAEMWERIMAGSCQALGDWQRPGFWLNIAELWDYIPKEEE